MAEEKKDDRKARGKKPAAKKEEAKAPVKEEPKAHKAEEAKAAPKPEAKKAEEKRPEPHAAPAEAKPEAKAAPKKKKRAEKKTRAFVARGKRKESVARATIKPGKGMIRINHMNLSSLSNPFVREIIREPVRYVGAEATGIDISVSVNGGGMMGQAQAARTAIANALVLYFDQLNLREKFIALDRSLVIEDTRRVETKKFRGPKARARFQKSYR
ncbi:MAG: 30S ribosomal protein S9 [Candidatus ainarchaeum sp.]|nr:30S ribosomal protein S9 [Candidatus ainarchaeum sp.]